MEPNTLYKKVFTESKTVTMISVHYEELVNLTLAEQLIPGMKYRITDYVTMYNDSQQSNFTSAGHRFDIIATALSENTLSENCSAMVNEDDNSGYFDDCNLEAWQIKYVLSPSIYRFTGYPQDVGKGYIYQMTDEHYNTAACDFKNRLYKGYYMFTYENSVGGETVYEDASLTAWCYGNTVNIDWVQYEMFHIPSCVFICTVNSAHSIRNNYVTAKDLFVRAESIQSNRFYEPMQAIGRLTIDGVTPFKMVANCEFRMGSILDIVALDNNLELYNCDFNVGRSAAVGSDSEITTETSLVNCVFNLSRALHTLNPYTWGLGNDGVAVNLFKGDNNTERLMVSKVTEHGISVSEGVWNASNSSYDWIDRTISFTTQ